VYAGVGCAYVYCGVGCAYVYCGAAYSYTTGAATWVVYTVGAMSGSDTISGAASGKYTTAGSVVFVGFFFFEDLVFLPFGARIAAISPPIQHIRPMKSATHIQAVPLPLVRLPLLLLLPLGKDPNELLPDEPTLLLLFSSPAGAAVVAGTGAGAGDPAGAGSGEDAGAGADVGAGVGNTVWTSASPVKFVSNGLSSVSSPPARRRMYDQRRRPVSIAIIVLDSVVFSSADSLMLSPSLNWLVSATEIFVSPASAGAESVDFFDSNSLQHTSLSHPLSPLHDSPSPFGTLVPVHSKLPHVGYGSQQKLLLHVH